jgi:hypothetical protein
VSNNGLEKCPTKPPHIPRRRDDIDVFKRSLAVLTEFSKSVPRERTRMLLPIEAFLLNYDEWATVIENGHARVVTFAGDTKDFHAVAAAAQQDGLSTVPREHFWDYWRRITTACDASSSMVDARAFRWGLTSR